LGLFHFDKFYFTLPQWPYPPPQPAMVHLALALTAVLAAVSTAAPTSEDHAAVNGMRIRVCPHSLQAIYGGAGGTGVAIFSDVGEAADAVKAARAGGHAGDITVELCEGLHRHIKPLVVGPEHTCVICAVLASLCLHHCARMHRGGGEGLVHHACSQ